MVSMKTIKALFLLLPLILSANDSFMLYDDSEVAVIKISVAPEDLVWMYSNVHSDSLHEATVHFSNALINETIEQVGLRIRGNTSRVSRKKSFKLSFNTFVPGRQFYDVDKLNLNGEHNDPSIIRSKLCWDHYQKSGMIAPRAAHCAVYINDVYYGLYISVEHIDDEFVKNHFADDSGNLWKCLWPADLTYRGPNPEDYHPYWDETRPYELKTNKDEYDYTQLARLIDIINNTPEADFADSLEKVLVVAEVLKYAAMNVLTGNWDDYWFLKNNYYVYHDPAIDRFHWIPYDNDNSFGIDWFNVDWTQVDPYTYKNIEETQGNSPGPRPLMENIMAQDQYRNLYTHFLEFFRHNIMRLELWESHLDSLKTMITPWAEADSFRTLDYGFSISDFHQSYSPYHYVNTPRNSGEDSHVKRGVKEFVIFRNASLLGQLVWQDVPPIIYDIDYWPKYPGPEDSIYVSAAAFSHTGLKDLTIAFHPADLTVVESYPMTFAPIAATTIVEEADRWLGVIPPLGQFGQGRFQIQAEDLNGQSLLFPRSDFVNLQVIGSLENPLVINEFLAKNDGANTDDNGEYDDWLEIYNFGDEDLDLSGMYLTDDQTNLTKWQFPLGGIVLAAHDYLLIWCDEDEEQPGLHTNFKLSANGEFIALTAADGTSIYDALSFGPQEVDISFGRFPDGSDVWEFFTQPTPGTNNMTSGINPSVFIHNDFSLNNFPNPFNAETTIRYSLPVGAEVKLSIFDLKGGLVVELVKGLQQRGEYQISWNAQDKSKKAVSVGIYIVRLQANGFNSTHKILLIK